jgi:hypothetical protein
MAGRGYVFGCGGSVIVEISLRRKRKRLGPCSHAPDRAAGCNSDSPSWRPLLFGYALGMGRYTDPVVLTGMAIMLAVLLVTLGLCFVVRQACERHQAATPGGWHRIADADRPRRTPPKTIALLEAAMRIGPAVSTICDHIHRHDGEAGVRRILGVLSLAKKHGPAVIEGAPKAALDLGVPTYRFLRRHLERRPSVPLTLRQVDPLIRQLTLYRDLIDRTTGDQ